MRPTLLSGLILLAFFALSSAGAALADGIKISGPLLEVNPHTHDFGQLTQDTERRINVVLRNAGTEALLIENVDSDCGCTTAMLPDTLLAPGDSTYLHVKLSTRHYSGLIKKHVMIQTNDPGAPQTVISLIAYVRSIVSVVPNTLGFDSVTRGEQPTQTTVLASARSDSLKILDVVYPTETFFLKQTETSDGDSLRYQFDFTIRPDAPVGAMSSNASIHTNIKSTEQIPIRLRGLIHGFFATNPTRLSLGQLRAGTGRMRKIKLTASAPGKHYVTNVSISDDALTTELITIEDGRAYEIEVTAPPSIPPGRYRCTVKIDTDDPAQPEIRVPVAVKVQESK